MSTGRPKTFSHVDAVCGGLGITRNQVAEIISQDAASETYKKLVVQHRLNAGNLRHGLGFALFIAGLLTEREGLWLDGHVGDWPPLPKHEESVQQ